MFTERFSAEQKLPATLNVGASAMALLTAYDWPGNIRQMENAIFRAVVLAEGTELTDKDFPQIAAQIPAYQSPELLATIVEHQPVDDTEDEQATLSDLLRSARADHNRVTGNQHQSAVTTSLSAPMKAVRFASLPMSRRTHSLCVEILSWPDEPGGAQAGYRAFNVVPQTQGLRDRP